MDNDITKKLDTFFKKYKPQQFKKGEILIRADDDPAGIYYLEEGLVRRYSITGNGEELMLNIYKPHSFFPMSWAMSDVHNTHFYEAMTQASTWRVPKEDMLRFIKQEPDVLYDLLRRVYIGIEGLWTHIEHLMSGNAYAKLLTAVIIIAKRFGKHEKDNIVIILNMKEKDLAAYAGMSRETASRELQLLKQKNLISYDKGTITITNMRKLENELTMLS